MYGLELSFDSEKLRFCKILLSRSVQKLKKGKKNSFPSFHHRVEKRWVLIIRQIRGSLSYFWIVSTPPRWFYFTFEKHVWLKNKTISQFLDESRFIPHTPSTQSQFGRKKKSLVKGGALRATPSYHLRI